MIRIAKCFIACAFLIASHIANAQLTGFYDVGPNGSDDFPCLSCATGIFQSINSNGISGNVIIRITGNLNSEDGSVSLNDYGNTGSILMAPNGPATRVIAYNGSNPGSIIDLNGADNFTIDGSFGGVGKVLRFVSSQADRPVIQVNNNAKNVTIKNCLIESDNASSFPYSSGMINSRSYGTEGNDSLTIENNSFKDYSGSVDYKTAIFVSAPATPGVQFSNLVIKDNEIDNPMLGGIMIEADNGSVVGATIEGNSIFASSKWTGSNSGDIFTAIYLNSGSGHTVVGNYVGGTAPQCSGNKMDLDCAPFSDRMNLIWIGGGASGTQTMALENNTIDNISILGPSATQAIINFYYVHPNVVAPVNFGSFTTTNITGSRSVTVLDSASSRIYVKERFNSLMNVLTIYNLNADVPYTLRNDQIGGILMDENSPLGMAFYGVSISGGNAQVFNVLVGDMASNILKLNNGEINVFNIAAPCDCEGNYIRGIKTGGNFSSSFRGMTFFTTGSGSFAVVGNVIGDVNLSTNSLNASIDLSNHDLIEAKAYGIQFLGNGAASVLLSNNSVGGFLMHSDSASQKIAFTGIQTGATFSNNMTIQNNRIGNAGLYNIVQQTNARVDGIRIIQPDCPDVNFTGNFVRGLKAETFFASGFAGIELRGKLGQNNNFNVIGNLVGDTATNALTNPSISIESVNSGIGNGSYGLYVEEQTLFTSIINNGIGGIRYLNSSGGNNPFIPFQCANTADSVVIENNTIGSGSVPRNIVMNANDASANLMYISLPDAMNNGRIKNNLVSNIQYDSNFNGSINFLRIASGTTIDSVSVTSNLFKNISIGAGGNSVVALGLNCDVSGTNISGNTFTDITVNSSKKGDVFYGINLVQSGSAHTVSRNTIQRISLTNTVSEENSFTGILVFGGSSQFFVNANKISGVKIAAAGTESLFKGILVNDADSARITNNIIQYNHQTSNDVAAFGLFDFANAGKINTYHNTINLRGTQQVSQTRFSACYYKNNNADRSILNNMFVNDMVGASTINYAVYFASEIGNITCAHNLMYAENNPDTVIYFTDVIPDLATWKNLGFGDKSAVPPVTQYLVDSVSGKQLTTLGNDYGSLNTGVTTDYLGNQRYLNAGPDFGAFEISNSSLQSGIITVFAANALPNQYILYPQPASTILNIKGEIEAITSIEIYSILGSSIQTITRFQESSIDVSSLMNGCYIMKINTINNEPQVVRFIKQ